MSKMPYDCGDYDDAPAWLDPKVRLAAKQALNAAMNDLLDKLALDHLPWSKHDGEDAEAPHDPLPPRHRQVG